MLDTGVQVFGIYDSKKFEWKIKLFEVVARLALKADYKQMGWKIDF